MNFILVDKMIKMEIGVYAEAIKCWSLDNEIFQQHFPGKPIVPGVLLTESVAQTLGILIEESYSKIMNTTSPVYPVLGIIHKTKFREFVEPGDQTIIKVNLDAIDFGHATGTGKVYVGDRLMMETKLTFMIGRENKMIANPFIKRIEESKYNILKGLQN